VHPVDLQVLVEDLAACTDSLAALPERANPIR
jgi:hypothetical protein